MWKLFEKDFVSILSFQWETRRNCDPWLPTHRACDYLIICQWLCKNVFSLRFQILFFLNYHANGCEPRIHSSSSSFCYYISHIFAWYVGISSRIRHRIENSLTKSFSQAMMRILKIYIWISRSSRHTFPNPFRDHPFIVRTCQPTNIIIYYYISSSSSLPCMKKRSIYIGI